MLLQPRRGDTMGRFVELAAAATTAKAGAGAPFSELSITEEGYDPRVAEMHARFAAVGVAAASGYDPDIYLPHLVRLIRSDAELCA